MEYFSCFSQKICFDTACKLSPMEIICMQHQILLSEENKKKIINLSSPEFTQEVVKVKAPIKTAADNI